MQPNINNKMVVRSYVSQVAVRPVIKRIPFGNEVRIEEHYTCPETGNFITKRLVGTEKIKDE
jgi:hypothetical protein